LNFNNFLKEIKNALENIKPAGTKSASGLKKQFYAAKSSEEISEEIMLYPN